MNKLIEVIGITLGNNSQIYYFSPNNLKLKENITVIVETEHGLQFGKVAKETFLISEKTLATPLNKVLRIASKQDYLANKKNIRDANIALKKCKELVEKQKLNMQMIDCSYTFDRSQLMFRFLSESRVDFRALAKELASIYKTRIELRQVGVRDKAKEVGGIGPCGRSMCCSCFFNSFESVSISMAKNQNIALNQAKINGSCGRLLCCLKYEDENYMNCRQCLPKIGDIVTLEEGKGIVKSLDILNHKYVVDITGIGTVEKSISCEKC